MDCRKDGNLKKCDYTYLKFKGFGKSGIVSAIGTLYYVWPVKTDIRETNLDNSIFFLSNSEKSFDFFTNFLANKFPHCPVIDMPSSEIEKELAGYLSGKIREIGLEPVYLYGTDFEKRIWETARKIPYGNVASYKELAQNAGYPNAFRAAGTALGNNPLMLVVPCHRVIRSNGEIGYFGGGEEVKLRLLDLEQPQQE
jgi:methylated-DNA-[protein]-cysteine S-methyltransferase